MKYLRNQPSKARRIKPRHVPMLQAALAHLMRKTPAVKSEYRNRIRLVGEALPACAPYELRLFATEWEIVSRALRPQGSNPEAGGQFAKWYALYTLLRKTFVFMTEGDRARIQAAKRSLSSRAK